MTDCYRVYTKVKKTLKQMLKLLKLDHQGQVVTLAMMITGIVLSRKAQLSVMSLEIPTAAQEQSVEMRMRRWVKDKLDVEAVYMPFARQILEVLSHLPLVMVMDGSQAGRGCMVLMVGVLYQKRALPIAWLVYKGKKGHASAERHIQVLEKVQPLLPESSEVVLLGDAEYDTTEMLLWMEKNTTWKYVLRTAPQIRVQTGTESQPLRDYPLPQGQLLFLQQVGFTQTATVTLNAIGWWGFDYKEPIFLITNFEDAYEWMIVQGLCVLAEGNLALIDRGDRRDKSLFRLGLDWLKYALKHSIDFHPSSFLGCHRHQVMYGRE